MQMKYLSRLILVGFFILTLILSAKVEPGWSRIIYFPSPHINTIQSAVDLSREGDTVLVAPGVYYENLDFRGKGVVLASHFILEFDTSLIEKTVIDGSKPELTSRGSVVRFVSEEGSGSVIQGFTLRNGIGSALDEFGYGGGIFCYLSAPRIINNRIENSEAHFGGGIACFYGDSRPEIISNVIFNNRGVVGAGVFSQGIDPFIQNNRIEENSSSYRGGGIFFKLCSPKIRGNFISQNTAVKYGGGIYGLATSAEIIDNWLKKNRAELNGGGIYISGESSAKIVGNIIESNYANLGGGLYNLYSKNFVANNTFVDNRASKGSGGIYCSGAYLPEIVNNILHLNQGGVYCIQGCLPQLSYNDLWNNSGANFTCDIPGLGDTTWGVNLNNTACDSFFNIFADPLFADSSYRLLCSSPCIDAGDSVFSPYEKIRNDIGAREYSYILGDVNSDGSKDLADVVFLISYLFKKGVSPCPSRSGDFNTDGKISLSDIIVLLYSLFHR
jgi:parallel beta-helix repeat protein